MNNLEKMVLVGTVIVLIVGGAFIVFTQGNSKEAVVEKSTMSHDMASSSEKVIEADAADLTSQNAVTININTSGFETSNIKIKQGTIVTWVNQDTIEHTVMAGRMDTMQSHTSSTGEDDFTSSALAKGDTHIFPFNTIGNFSYHCSKHPSDIGGITVVE
jgi:plastocyanin